MWYKRQPLEGGADGIEVVSYDQAPELVKALMSGQVEYAVLPEHVATVAQKQATQSGKNLDRTANLQEVWAKVTGGQARFPLAGVVMPQKLVDSHQAPVAGVPNELEEAVAKVNAPGAQAVADPTRPRRQPRAPYPRPLRGQVLRSVTWGHRVLASSGGTRGAGDQDRCGAPGSSWGTRIVAGCQHRPMSSA